MTVIMVNHYHQLTWRPQYPTDICESIPSFISIAWVVIRRNQQARRLIRHLGSQQPYSKSLSLLRKRLNPNLLRNMLNVACPRIGAKAHSARRGGPRSPFGKHYGGILGDRLGGAVGLLS